MKQLKADLVSPEKFLSFIDANSDRNRDLIKSKNIIWVLGNENTEAFLLQNAWVSMLKTIGVHPEKITSINLKKND